MYAQSGTVVVNLFYIYILLVDYIRTYENTVKYFKS